MEGLGAHNSLLDYRLSPFVFYYINRVSDARKLKALEAENNKLKKLLAEQMLVTTFLN